MREMKDSGIEWIGAIPQAWKTDRLQWHLKEINVSNNPIQTQNILSLTIEAGVIPYAEKGNQGNKAKEDYSQYKIAFPDTLVINSMNVIIGAVGISQYFGCVSPVYYVFEPIEGTDLRYIYYLFTNTGFQKEMRKYAKGILEIRLRISSNDMLKRIVPSPPFKEQQRIADYLDKMCAEIDAVLEKTRASIEEYKKLKQAVITQAVTRGVRGDRPMKDSGIEWIGEIPAEWDVLSLVAHTSMLTPMRDRPENLDGPIPWVRIEDFEGKYIESSKAGLGVSMKTVKEMNLKVYPVGTILCTSSCIMGKCAIVSRELVSNQRFIGIIPDRTTDKTYLYYLMTSNAERMNFLSTGALQANLSRSAFEHLKVQFPPYSEQQEIVAYLDDKCEKIDALIARKQQYLTEIENYKKSLIYEYVTGKKEVV